MSTTNKPTLLIRIINISKIKKLQKRAAALTRTSVGKITVSINADVDKSAFAGLEISAPQLQDGRKLTANILLMANIAPLPIILGIP